jgi:lipid-A-disaccharide synthase
MRYYVISGEASGDLHGSALLRELKRLDPEADFRVWGGDLMRELGATVVKHYRDLAFMGFTEVVRNLGTILGNLSFCKKDILDYKPDVLILIDYPGFNLRIAEFASENNLRVFYYISPQIWAWKQSRVKKIKKYVERMFVILPFEKSFYKQFGMDVDFVGHPLLDSIEQKRKNFLSPEKFRELHGLSSKPLIALLPGSRKQEISVMLPKMMSVIADFPEFQFVVAAAPSQPESFYRDVMADTNVPLLCDCTYELLAHSHAALVTSGTATLETALLGTPEVVCYKGGRISYMIARKLIRVKYISLVNLIMDRKVVTELIQDDLTTAGLKKELKLLLQDDVRKRIAEDYRDLILKLGGSGASALTAKLMYDYLRAPGRPEASNL